MEVPTEVITCSEDGCGISFAVPAWWLTGKRSTHANFWCPNGHVRHYPAETKEEALRRERDRAFQQIARAEDEARQAKRLAGEWEAATRKAEAATRRLKKRAAAGSCPQCNRTFANMARHMKHQHPQFVCETGAKVVPMKKAS